mmetsp:Transcript_3054/g.10741  ORF Transcript_3054/g.10741 Transcript_3054/m.10741 type:complete len:729 (-) Transcript_3054:1526-3712(-)
MGLCCFGGGTNEINDTSKSSNQLQGRQKGITEFAAKAGRVVAGDKPLTDAPKEELDTIAKALTRVLVFAKLEKDVVREVASKMTVRTITKDQVLIREGDEGDDEMYVVKSGLFHVTELHNGQQVRVNTKNPGDVFGELALMYGAARSATVVAVQECVVYVLQRSHFRKYVREAAGAETTERDTFLNSVPILTPLTSEERIRLAEALEEKSFNPGQNVVKQGEAGDLFYIVLSGEAIVTEKDGVKEKKVNHLFRGDFFGEQALFTNKPRAASVTVSGSSPLRVLHLHRDQFVTLLGPLQELMERAKSPVVVRRRMSEISGQQNWSSCEINLSATRMLRGDGGSGPLRATEVAITCRGTVAASHFNIDAASHGKKDTFDVNLKEGRLLGGGASSTVCLCKDPATNSTYALKRMKKVAVMSTPDHIFCEQAITKTLVHPYCMRQYGSFQDKASLYLLFEHLDGCDLMDALAGVAVVRHMRPPGRPFARKVKVLQGMTEDVARYYIGCVILAFEYVHGNFIVYRDLKPENVLIDKDGYPKLGDFGFAKNIEKAGGRTYTFCGTPGYVAPEVVLARGYGTAVDWWGLGVMTYVLLSGQQPFSRTLNGVPDDPLTVMKRIVDPNWQISYPWYSSEKAQDFIGRLLERWPAKRLGNLAKRADDLKNHPWFTSANFDWEALEMKKTAPPPNIVKGEHLNAQKKRLAELEADLRKLPDDVDESDPLLMDARAVFADF